MLNIMTHLFSIFLIELCHTSLLPFLVSLLRSNTHADQRAFV